MHPYEHPTLRAAIGLAYLRQKATLIRRGPSDVIRRGSRVAGEIADRQQDVLVWTHNLKVAQDANAAANAKFSEDSASGAAGDQLAADMAAQSSTLNDVINAQNQLTAANAALAAAAAKPGAQQAAAKEALAQAQAEGTLGPNVRLSIGSKGPAVVAWQKIIGTTPDGIFGPNTAAATKKWQVAHGVPATGVFDALTANAAAAAGFVPLPADTVSPVPTPPIQQPTTLSQAAPTPPPPPKAKTPMWKLLLGGAAVVGVGYLAYEEYA